MTTPVPQTWRKVWQDGFAPLLTTKELRAVRDALANGDRRIVQGATTYPLPEDANADRAAVCGCLLAFVGAERHGGFACKPDELPAEFDPARLASVVGVSVTNYTPATVGQCEEEFAQLCYAADERLGEPAACRWFLNWFDDTPRAEVARELVSEINEELIRRGPADTAA